MTVSSRWNLQQFLGNVLRFRQHSRSSPVASAFSSNFSMERVRCVVSVA